MKFGKLLLPALLSIMVVVLFTPSCKKDPKPGNTDDTSVASFGAESALRWNKLFLEAERYAAGYRPGPAPRSMGYMGLAAYEACISGMPDYNSMESRYFGLSIPDVESGKEYHWPSVVHAVYSYLIPKFFPNPPASVVSQMNSLVNELNNKYLAEAGQEVYDRSKAHGESVAKAIWDWSKTDVFGHDAYTDPFKDYDWADHFKKDGDWRPTVPGPAQPMFPHWGKVRTFAISEDEKLSRPPIKFSESPTSEFYSQALEVYAQNTPTLSYVGEWIGEFWSDDLLNLTFSPGPRWVAIANQVIEHDNVNLETSLEAYAKVGMAVSDAAVACWHSKYVYNLERPETYIQRVIDPNWDCNLDNPLNGDIGFTPPFPAYPSGHSTMGAAGAEALASVFGYAYSMTDRCHEGRTEFEGVPRTFGSFFEMAQENAWSRVPLGVHFRMDCEEGVRLGTVIARKVNNLPWKK